MDKPNNVFTTPNTPHWNKKEPSHSFESSLKNALSNSVGMEISINAIENHTLYSLNTVSSIT